MRWEACSALLSVRNKQVNVRMRKEFPAAIAAQSQHAEFARFIELRGKVAAVQRGHRRVHHLRTPAQHGQAIARAIEVLLDC